MRLVIKFKKGKEGANVLFLKALLGLHFKSSGLQNMMNVMFYNRMCHPTKKHILIPLR